MITCAFKQNIDEEYYSHIHLKRCETNKMGQGLGKKLPNKKLLLYSQQTQLQPYVIEQIYDAFRDRVGTSGK
jgi:hypothetical protein